MFNELENLSSLLALFLYCRLKIPQTSKQTCVGGTFLKIIVAKSLVLWLWPLFSSCTFKEKTTIFILLLL
jgi:hypothetical protein